MNLTEYRKGYILGSLNAVAFICAIAEKQFVGMTLVFISVVLFLAFLFHNLDKAV
jgi:hypothetical protein